MPNPTPGQVHVDSLLTDESVAYLQSSTQFVADRVFPLVGVQKASGKIAQYSKADFLRDEAAKRAPGAPSQRAGYGTSSTTYNCDEWDLAHAIDDQVIANADDPYAPESDAVKFLTQKMLISREVQWASKFFSTGNIWTGSSDGADLVSGTDFVAWSNAASTPLEDIANRCVLVEKNTGFLPNKLVVARQGWMDLKNHPDIVDRVKHTSPDAVTTDIVARLMGLDEILVTAGVRNTAGEGLSHSGSYIAGDNALLVYAPESPSLMAPASGLTLVWDGLLGSNTGQVIDRYRDDDAKSEVIRITAAYGHKKVAGDLGVFFTNCSTRI